MPSTLLVASTSVHVLCINLLSLPLVETGNPQVGVGQTGETVLVTTLLRMSGFSIVTDRQGTSVPSATAEMPPGDAAGRSASEGLLTDGHPSTSVPMVCCSLRRCTNGFWTALLCEYPDCRWNCSKCGRNFHSYDSLVQSLRRSHGVVSFVRRCWKCRELFSNRRTRNSHLRKCRGMEKDATHPCPVCSFAEYRFAIMGHR